MYDPGKGSIYSTFTNESTVLSSDYKVNTSHNSNHNKFLDCGIHLKLTDIQIFVSNTVSRNSKLVLFLYKNVS